MRRILGRKRNLLMKADGSRFLPRAGFETFHEIAPIQQYQVVQHALDDIEFKLVAVEPLTPAQEEAFADTLRKALQFEGRIRVVQSREYLPDSIAGKYEDFICKLDEPPAEAYPRDLPGDRRADARVGEKPCRCWRCWA